MKTLFAIAAVFVLAFCAFPQQAEAGGRFSVHFSSGGYSGYGGYYGGYAAPYSYYRPAPVVYYSQPVYYRPAPRVIYRRAPVRCYTPRTYYHSRYRHYDRW